MDNQTFKIESRQEDFRVCKMDPVEMLSISMVVDFDNYTQNKQLIDFALTHVEVKMGDNWVKVLQKGKESNIYNPMGIDLVSLREITMYMIQEVIGKAF